MIIPSTSRTEMKYKSCDKNAAQRAQRPGKHIRIYPVHVYSILVVAELFKNCRQGRGQPELIIQLYLVAADPFPCVYLGFTYRFSDQLEPFSKSGIAQSINVQFYNSFLPAVCWPRDCVPLAHAADFQSRPQVPLERVNFTANNIPLSR
jgi:hypothetical protein